MRLGRDGYAPGVGLPSIGSDYDNADDYNDYYCGRSYPSYNAFTTLMSTQRAGSSTARDGQMPLAEYQKAGGPRPTRFSRAAEGSESASGVESQAASAATVERVIRIGVAL